MTNQQKLDTVKNKTKIKISKIYNDNICCPNPVFLTENIFQKD